MVIAPIPNRGGVVTTAATVDAAGNEVERPGFHTALSPRVELGSSV